MKKETKMMFADMISIVLAILITMLTILIYSPELHSDGAENKLETIEPVTTTEVEVTTNVVVTTTTIATTAITTTIATTTTMATTTTTITTTTEETLPIIVTETECDNEDTESNTYLFYRESMRVHRLDCIYADSSCMELIEGDYIDEARPCQECNPDINIGTIYEPPYEPVINENEEDYVYEGPDGFERNWSVSEMTYYSGSYGCYGASGRTLIDNYSVACNSIPLGTIVYIKSSDGSVDGYYRVDDTGGMGDHVIDIFYSDYSNTPSSFRQLGRVSCEVWIVG